MNSDQQISNEKFWLDSYRQGGSIELLGKLYKPYMPLVYGLCLKYLKDTEAAQDAVMEIFELLALKLREHEVSYFKSWLYITSKNYCLSVLRKNRPMERFVHNEQLDDKLSYEPIGDEQDFENVRLENLNDCIQKLNEEQKRCIELFYLEKNCYQEITDKTDYKLKKVKSYIQNGKRNLKNCLEKVG